MRKIIFAILFFLTLNSVLSGQVLAAGDGNGTVPVYGGVPIYGGEPVYGGGVLAPRAGEILVDKSVKNPATGIFVDHLGPSDPKFRPQQFITFRIVVKNPSNETLKVVEVSDKIPDFVDFMSGPGKYDPESRNLSFQVENIGPDSSQEFELKGRTVHQAVLPADKEIVCEVNVVEAKAGDLSDRDESQFCIEKEAPAPPQVPSAGPEHWIMSLVGFTGAALTGLFLRKKAVIRSQ